MLSKVVSSTIFFKFKKIFFLVYSMTWLRIEPQSPRPLANTLLIRPMAQSYVCMTSKHVLLITFLNEPVHFLPQVLLYNSHDLTSVICLHTVCSIWPYQVLPFWVRVDLGAIAMLQDWSLVIRWFNVISRTLVGGRGSYPSA